mmetsp:Transcript_996/g.2030  ORF Transcript_996/g.2030 Transcript_996/m.2030 type:complete len:260 (-) Transcript_996:2285-3064(-)
MVVFKHPTCSRVKCTVWGYRSAVVVLASETRASMWQQFAVFFWSGCGTCSRRLSFEVPSRSKPIAPTHAAPARRRSAASFPIDQPRHALRPQRGAACTRACCPPSPPSAAACACRHRRCLGRRRTQCREPGLSARPAAPARTSCAQCRPCWRRACRPRQQSVAPRARARRAQHRAAPCCPTDRWRSRLHGLRSGTRRYAGYLLRLPRAARCAGRSPMHSRPPRRRATLLGCPGCPSLLVHRARLPRRYPSKATCLLART